MTDRLNALIVVLDKDIRDDDAQPLMDAIKMMKGVISVSGSVADSESVVAESRVRSQLSKKLWEVLYPKK